MVRMYSCRSRAPCALFSTTSFLLTILYLLMANHGAYAVALNNQSNTAPTDPNCHCEGSKWYDVMTFFGLNIGAHALTARFDPGSGPGKCIWLTLLAIFFPYARILEELEKIAEVRLGKLWKEDAIDKAKRARALCKVVKGKDEPFFDKRVFGQREGIDLPDGYNLKTVKLRDRVKPKEQYYYTLTSRLQTQSGKPTLPKAEGQNEPTRSSPMGTGNKDANNSNEIHENSLESSQLMPSNPDVEANVFRYQPGSDKLLLHRLTLAKDIPKFELPQSSSFLKATVSVGQAAYVIFTLIRASQKCTQLTMFGYVSPAFMVLPYATMSLVNALSIITTPNYPMLYMVYTEDLGKAIEEGWEFDCQAIVGELDVDNDSKGLNAETSPGENPISSKAGEKNSVKALGENVANKHNQKSIRIRNPFMLCVASVIGAMTMAGPYVAMSIVTNFQNEHSTPVERGIIMAGLVAGQVASLSKYILRVLDRLTETTQEDGWDTCFFNLLWLLWGALAVLIAIAAAIIPVWGFVIMGQMLKKTGNCVYL